MTINVVMLARSTLHTSPGGDSVQVMNTAQYLRDLGVNVDVKLTTDEVDYGRYDLMHFFNIIRPNDILFHIESSSIPFLVSTIFVDYSEYERKARAGLLRYLTYLVSSDQLEYMKVIARLIKNNEKLRSYSYLWRGQRSSVRYIIEKAAMLLPNSESEYMRLSKHFGVSSRYRVIPNAIDTSVFNPDEEPEEKYTDCLICVGRIEGRKNQLNLIKAVNETDHRLFIIGKPSPNQLSYYHSCLKEAETNSKVCFIDHISQSELSSIMRAARVHVLASWFETTGLVSLEAAYLGCNIVITDKGDQSEYFEDMATYCDPDDIDSIVDAINIAFDKPMDDRLSDKISRAYTWQNTAEETRAAYLQVLDKD